MAYFLDNSNERRPLPGKIYLIQGSSRRIKVNGLGLGKKNDYYKKCDARSS